MQKLAQHRVAILLLLAIGAALFYVFGFRTGAVGLLITGAALELAFWIGLLSSNNTSPEKR